MLLLLVVLWALLVCSDEGAGLTDADPAAPPPSPAGRFARPARLAPLPVIILFKAIGSAPLMRQNQFKVTGLYPFQVRPLRSSPCPW